MFVALAVGILEAEVRVGYCKRCLRVSAEFKESYNLNVRCDGWSVWSHFHGHSRFHGAYLGALMDGDVDVCVWHWHELRRNKKVSV